MRNKLILNSGTMFCQEPEASCSISASQARSIRFNAEILERPGADIHHLPRIYTPPPNPAMYSVEEKRSLLVYETDKFIFLKLPSDPQFIRREGIDMQHCLAWAHQDYCRRMVAKEIELYSMAGWRDGQPKVDIEVALVKGSYSDRQIQKPTVTQIRGPRNEVPPKDHFIAPLMEFFSNY